MISGSLAVLRKVHNMGDSVQLEALDRSYSLGDDDGQLRKSVKLWPVRQLIRNVPS